jgi:ATP-binding cassette, subfamily B, bacterial
MDLLSKKIAIHPGNVHLPVDSVSGEVVFKNVSFVYQDKQGIIENLSLHISAGKTIAIVGYTGSGKSTLVKLLLRFYEMRSRNITVDDIELQKLNISY